MKKLLIFIPIFFFMTGCWNYRELNTLAITTTMAIDKEDDKYEVSILIANGKNNQTSPKEGQSQTVVYSGKGKTVDMVKGRWLPEAVNRKGHREDLRAVNLCCMIL